jgi:hypothetical protein
MKSALFDLGKSNAFSPSGAALKFSQSFQAVGLNWRGIERVETLELSQTIGSGADDGDIIAVKIREETPRVELRG